MSLQSAAPEGGYAVFIERMEQSGAMSVPQLTAEEESAPVWPMALVALYFAGVALCLAIRSYQLVRLRMTIARGCLWTERLEGGITLYCHARSIPPFSWMRSVVMSETDWDSEAGPAIFAHEKAHVLQDQDVHARLLGVEGERPRRLDFVVAKEGVEGHEDAGVPSVRVVAEPRDVVERIARRLTGAEGGTSDVDGVRAVLDRGDARVGVARRGEKFQGVKGKHAEKDPVCVPKV